MVFLPVGIYTMQNKRKHHGANSGSLRASPIRNSKGNAYPRCRTLPTVNQRLSSFWRSLRGIEDERRERFSSARRCGSCRVKHRQREDRIDAGRNRARRTMRALLAPARWVFGDLILIGVVRGIVFSGQHHCRVVMMIRHRRHGLRCCGSRHRAAVRTGERQCALQRYAEHKQRQQ